MLAQKATSHATSSNPALSGANNLATALPLNASPHLAKSPFHLCPLFVGSIGVTSLLTPGGTPTRLKPGWHNGTTAAAHGGVDPRFQQRLVMRHGPLLTAGVQLLPMVCGAAMALASAPRCIGMGSDCPALTFNDREE